MNIDKGFIYGWGGANETIFRWINALSGEPTYDSLMVFLSNVGDHHNFPYYFIALAVYAGIDFIVRKINKRGGAANSLTVWIGVLSVFACAYAVDGMIVKLLKEYFSFPRPYIALDHVHVLGSGKENDDYHSFPSGHASFITVLVCSLWPVLSGRVPQIGALLIFAVCWSRIAMGMHFPADVLAGFLISAILVTVLRAVIYTIYARLLRWKC